MKVPLFAGWLAGWLNCRVGLLVILKKLPVTLALTLKPLRLSMGLCLYRHVGKCY